VSAVAADPAPGKGIVLFDGDCPFCRRSVAILKRLDWLGRLHFRSARNNVEHLPQAQIALDSKRLLDEMHVLTPDRRRAYLGYAAFRWIAWRLPLGVLIAPFLYIPGVPAIGNRVYRWVAKNRMDLVPCTDGACPVHLKRT
jgi:predicted DCC family thiol-disulfide oxidoreductase YuxK